jgi:hypothetical protein
MVGLQHTVGNHQILPYLLRTVVKPYLLRRGTCQAYSYRFTYVTISPGMHTVTYRVTNPLAIHQSLKVRHIGHETVSLGPAFLAPFGSSL